MVTTFRNVRSCTAQLHQYSCNSLGQCNLRRHSSSSSLHWTTKRTEISKIKCITIKNFALIAAGINQKTWGPLILRNVSATSARWQVSFQWFAYRYQNCQTLLMFTLEGLRKHDRILATYSAAIEVDVFWYRSHISGHIRGMLKSTNSNPCYKLNLLRFPTVSEFANPRGSTLLNTFCKNKGGLSTNVSGNNGVEPHARVFFYCNTLFT